MLEGHTSMAVVHMQVALSRRGFACHGDDAQWWQYGDSTYNAVQVFQVGLAPDC